MSIFSKLHIMIIIFKIFFSSPKKQFLIVFLFLPLARMTSMTLSTCFFFRVLKWHIYYRIECLAYRNNVTNLSFATFRYPCFLWNMNPWEPKRRRDTCNTCHCLLSEEVLNDPVQKDCCVYFQSSIQIYSMMMMLMICKTEGFNWIVKWSEGKKDCQLFPVEQQDTSFIIEREAENT